MSINNRETRLYRLNGYRVNKIDYDKAILPLGSTEYHGPHLPYGADGIAAETIATTWANELGNTLVLPTLYYGVSQHHTHWPWTLSLQGDTLSRIISEIGESLVKHDIWKLLLLSSHDGNHPAVGVAAHLLSKKWGMNVAVFTGWQQKARTILQNRLDIDLDHAGQSETSLLLYAAPETVNLEHVTKQPNEPTDLPVQIIGKFELISPVGYSGNAVNGTEEEGQTILDALTSHVVPFIRKLDKNGWKKGTWLSELKTSESE
jgi:creatinine amidohydrolase